MPECVFAVRRVKSASQASTAQRLASRARRARRPRVEAVEAARGHAARVARPRITSRPSASQTGAGAGSAKGVGDRLVRERGREQQRAIGELAPEIAPDVVGQHRVGLEELEKRVHLARALADRAVDLADDDRAAVAAQDAAGPELVGAEIDEAAHRPLARRSAGDGDLVEPVLRRQHEAVLGKMRRERGAARPRCDAPSRRARCG